jgi:hypothetical protein
MRRCRMNVWSIAIDTRVTATGRMPDAIGQILVTTAGSGEVPAFACDARKAFGAAGKPTPAPWPPRSPKRPW